MAVSATLRALLPNDFARQIVTGRDLANRHRRAPEEEAFSTACHTLDDLLAGGLRRGSMVELVGHRSSGRFALVQTVLAAATQRGEAVALVDLGDSLDPRSAHEAGVDLERVLWVRPKTVKEAMGSAEVILSSGIPLLVLDLGMPPLAGGRGVEAAWLRLARRARVQRVALLVASPYRVSGTAAQEVLVAERGQARWQGTGRAPRLLQGLDARVRLDKSRRPQHLWRQHAETQLQLRSDQAIPEGPGAAGIDTPPGAKDSQGSGAEVHPWTEAPARVSPGNRWAIA